MQTCPDEAAFKEELQQYFTDIQAEQAWVETNGAEAMSAVLELVRRHKVGASSASQRMSLPAGQQILDVDMQLGGKQYSTRCLHAPVGTFGGHPFLSSCSVQGVC
jgi:hypothetical protein